MSPMRFFRFSFHSFRSAVLVIIIQIVSNTYYASSDLSTSLNDENMESFSLPGPSPMYPTGGDFGNRVIDLGGLEVEESFYFTKIWETQSPGGPMGLGASFYEPAALPDGFNLLGHYCKVNTTDMFTSVLVAKDNTGDPSNGALKSPLDYILVWTSNGLNMTNQVEHAYIWLPEPPQGYRVMGHIVTTSPEKPSLDKIKCVREDFTDVTEVDQWLWGFKIDSSPIVIDVYTTKPVNRELSVPTGTFLAKGSGSSAHSLACLKMVKSNPYSAMPNSLQITTMINLYAPWVYFHPHEEYLPSSVMWFFQNGAELHQTGETPIFVLKYGDNLPNNGSLDDAFLDLPLDQPNKDRVKKGSLADAIAYIHVKPALGGTFTDLAIWLYYPFNGGGSFQLGPFTISLGQIGEHVSDWEHMTLRIDNYRGVLKAIYLSQHAKGKWVAAQEFELKNGTRPVVYASLHGHSHYHTPTYHVHSTVQIDSSDIEMLYEEFNKSSKKSPIVKGDKFLGFGIRDDTAISDVVMDIASRHKVVYVDYKSVGIEPWLNYTGRWGPKITYKFAIEIQKAIEQLPDKVKEVANTILHKLPPELLGQEGPPGPKMRDTWIGDERV